MRFAEDYRGQLKDKVVYIAGSGPSLDSYPNGFLDDKIGITLHLAYLKFPDATYRGVGESLIMEWLQANRPEFFTKKNIFASPLYLNVKPQRYLGSDLGKSRGWPAPIFVRYDSDWGYFARVGFEKLIKRAIAGEATTSGTYSTVLHSMLFAVLTMGSKEIHLIGCDHARSASGKVYYSLAQQVEASGLRVRKRGREWYRPEMCQRQKHGTALFIGTCRKYGVIIKRYTDYNHWRGQDLLGGGI